MIFNVPGHINMIRNGLAKQHLPIDNLKRLGLAKYFLPADYLNRPIETRIVKTQTRRPNRGIYKVGKDYAVQQKRGVKAETDIRIVMDRIWRELYAEYLCCEISEEDAWAEGGYTVIEFEELFRKLNPKWTGDRWAYEFHVVERR